MRTNLPRSLAAALAICALSATPAAARTQTVGSTAPAALAGDSLFTGMQCISALQLGSAAPAYVVPFDGRVTAWAYRGQPSGGASARLEVYRPAGSERWLVVGQTRMQRARPHVVNRFRASIPVRAGDVVGLRATIGCAWTTGVMRDSVQTFGYETARGSVATPDGPGFYGGRLNVSATVQARR